MCDSYNIMSSNAVEFVINFRFFIGGRAAELVDAVDGCSSGCCPGESVSLSVQRCKQTMSPPLVFSRRPWLPPWRILALKTGQTSIGSLDAEILLLK
jgi:hypothetical protein